MKKILFLLLLLTANAFGQTIPTWYYTADETNSLAPTIGTGNINPFTSSYSIGTTGGIVGKFLVEPPFTDHVESNWPIPTSSFTWMGWIRPGYRFNLARNAVLFNFCNMSASFQYPYLKFSTSTKPAVGAAFEDGFLISFYGINKASWHNLFDGNWHHLAFVFNATTGVKQVWIDGQLPSGFSKSITGGSINAGTSTVNYWADFNGIMTRYAGDIDEVAIWSNTAVTAAQIYNNYSVSLAGNHYTTALAGSVPAPQSVTGSLDSMDFMPGTVIPTPVGTQTTGVTVSALDQLRSQPLGRYRYFATASDSFPVNFHFYDPSYMGGLLQAGYTNAQVIQDAVDIGAELALRHNMEYQLWQIGDGTLTGPTTYMGKSLALKKANLRIKIGITHFRRQASPYDAIPNDNSQPPYLIQFYLHNSSNQKLDVAGNVSANGRPCPSFTYAQSLLACPDTVMYWMGDSLYKAIRRLQTAYGADSANFNIYHILENGEDETRILDPAMALDPRVPGWVAAAGVSNIKFQSTAQKRRSLAFSTKFQGTLQCTDSMLYAEYQKQGNPFYFSDWDTVRFGYTPWQEKFYMSTSDLYLRNPWEWLYGNLGAFHGLRWFMDNQPIELIRNKTILNSPFVENGSDINECKNVRPKQYLGILKVMGVMGAITYYASVFNESSFIGQNPNPKNIIGGWGMTEFAQAITTRFRETMFHGYLMQGDMPQVLDSANSGTRGFSFNAGYGKYANYVVVRRDSAITSYVIGACINPNTNDVGGCPQTDSCVITLAGQTVKFMVRDQGSIYRYDNSVSPAIWYQYDGWHERSHPYRWTNDFYFHMANSDNATRPPLKTYVPAGTAAGDYRIFLTALSHADTATVFPQWKYYFNPRTVDTLHLWVRARVRTLGQTTGMITTIDGSNSFTISGITDTNWFWYRRQGVTIIKYPDLDDTLHYFSLQASNKYLEVEQFALVHSGDTIFPNNESGCGTIFVSITPSSPSFCTGSSVNITANSSSAYLWSTGATTQTINVSSAGAYTVTVTDALGCTGTLSATVSAKATPSTPTITPSGSTTFCSGNSITLTASSGSGLTYLWSTGATTQAITVSTAGSYRVTVTNTVGCTASSLVTTVTVNPAATTPTITPGGPTTFCTGSSVTLTASSASSYLWSNGATTQATSVSTTGTYTVTITNGSGCTASASIGVTVNTPPPTPTISAGGPTTFCQGSSVTLTSSVSPSGLYSWTTGAVTSTISASVTGSYRVTVSNSNGCTASSAATSVTVNGNPILASISPVQNTCPATTFDLSTITLTNTGTAGTKSYYATQADAIAATNPISSTVSSTGTYWIRVTTVASCFDYKSVGVVIASCSCVSAPTANAGSDQTICSGSTATMAGSVGGSATAGTWSTSGTGTFAPNTTTLNAVYAPSVADRNAGSVTITLTTDNPAGAPCVAASNQMILIIAALPVPTVTPGGPTTFCTGSSVVLSANSFSSYVWSTAATTQAITVTATGTYTVTVTNASGCTATATGSATANSNPATPTITPTGSTTFCSGSSVLLTATSSTTYRWSNGATTQAITATLAGTYIVTVTNVNGCEAVSAPTSVTVTSLPPTPTISTNGSTTFCAGGSVILTSSAGTGNLWSDGSTTQSLTVSTAGTWTVTVTNASSCTASSAPVATSVTSAPPDPTITPGGSTTFCNLDSVLLTSSSGAAYLWTEGQTTQSIYVKNAGTYTVTITDGAGCTASSAGEDITVLPTPNIPTISTNKSPILCTGDSVTLTSNRLTGNQWSTGATTRSITVHDAGVYTVTVTNVVGCSRTSAAITVSYINCNITCRVVTNLTAGQITRTAANLRWDTTNVATDYIIQLTNTRTGQITRTTVQGVTHFIKWKSLTPGTAYKWKVQAVCGPNTFMDYSKEKIFTTLR